MRSSMFEQTTQLRNESSSMETVPVVDSFQRDHLYLIAPPGNPFAIRIDVRERLLVWITPDSERTPLTTPEVGSHVTYKPYSNESQFPLQLLDNATNHRLWELIAEYRSRGVIGFRVRLAQALGELDQVLEEAQSEEYEIPSNEAIANAEYIIKQIYEDSIYSLQVYPMPDGEVAIDAANGKGSSVLILCNSDGSALCLVNINGNQRRAHYSNSNTLPDGFISEALDELQQKQEA